VYFIIKKSRNGRITAKQLEKEIGDKNKVKLLPLAVVLVHNHSFGVWIVLGGNRLKVVSSE
jgi:hypothetical protein